MFQGSNWTGVELDEFMDCPYNLAHNRQTRMLADLTLAGCYTGFNSTEDQLERDRILLQSAKHNLANMAFFGLTEQQSISQYIFEQTFQLDFANSFDQANATLSAQAIAELTPSQVMSSSFSVRIFLFLESCEFDPLHSWREFASSTVWTRSYWLSPGS